MFKKKFSYILNFSVFAGIVPSGMLTAVFGSQNFINARENKVDKVLNIAYTKKVLKYKIDETLYYISLRSNPMNNFVSLTTEDENYTYVLCDTSKSSDGIKYARNTGIAKFDYEGNIKGLWILPNSTTGQENDNLYTTNIVFGDTENTLYVLAGIRNPAKTLNDVYGNANVPAVMYLDNKTNDNASAEIAYFDRNSFPYIGSFDPTNPNYAINISNYSFNSYQPIKIFKLNSQLIQQGSAYSFEFPPAEVIKKNSDNPVSVYNKTIIAGFGGGQYLNYWDENSTFINNYYFRSRPGGNEFSDTDKVSLMNSSFFHYLQYGQVFDYLGNDQFLMVPKYIGIDPNIGGLYSLVSSLTKSVASLSSYISLYQELYKYKGEPEISTNYNNHVALVFSSSVLDYQYRYLDGYQNIVNVTSNSEFALKESVIRLVLLSIGYFLPDKLSLTSMSGNVSKYNNSIPGWMLNNYGVVTFTPNKSAIVEKYKLYLFNRYRYTNVTYSFINFDNFMVKLPHFVIDNMLVQKDENGKKRYAFLLRFSSIIQNDTISSLSSNDYYNADPRNIVLYGTHDLADHETKIGFTWEEFSNTYLPIRQSQLQNVNIALSLGGKYGNQTDSTAINYLDSIYSSKIYDHSVVTGWGSTTRIFQYLFDIVTLSETKLLKEHGAMSDYDGFASSSGSKYIIYDGKMIMADPVWSSKLVVFNSDDYMRGMNSNSYKNSYSYASDPISLESFNRISSLFLLPNNSGFGYLTYKNEIYFSFVSSNDFNDRQLNSSDLKYLNFSGKNKDLVVKSVVPAGKKIYISVADKNGIVSSGYYSRDQILGNSNDNNLTTILTSIIVSIVAMVLIGIGIYFYNHNLKNNKHNSIYKTKNKKNSVVGLPTFLPTISYSGQRRRRTSYSNPSNRFSLPYSKRFSLPYSKRFSLPYSNQSNQNTSYSYPIPYLPSRSMSYSVPYSSYYQSGLNSSIHSFYPHQYSHSYPYSYPHQYSHSYPYSYYYPYMQNDLKKYDRSGQ